MDDTCPYCMRVIKDGERVRLEIEAIYKHIPSKRFNCIYQEGIVRVAGTMRHANCQTGD